MVYRDMTFCVNDKCKKTCSRKLTKKITEKANKLGMPIAVSNYFCTDCGNELGSSCSAEEDDTVEEMS